MPTGNLSDIEAPAPASSSRGNLSDIEGPATPEPSSVGHELFRQLIADPYKALKENPLGALTSALGTAFSVINPGGTPIPEAGGRHISVTTPTQGMAVQDIFNRGPAAVTAAGTLGTLGAALPIASKIGIGNIASATGGALSGAAKAAIAPANIRRFGLSIPGGNVIGGAIGGGAAARALGLPSEAGAIIGGAAPIVRGAITGVKGALANRALATQAQNLLAAAQRAPGPESVLPASVTAELTRPSEVTPPAGAMTQLNTQAAKPALNVEAIKAGARSTRASTANTLADALQNEGMADVGQTMPVFRLGDFARLHKIDWPADQAARINLLEATRAALRQRTTK